jgi:hypothetical protein
MSAHPPSMNPSAAAASAAADRALMAARLSTGARVGHVALLLVSLAMATAIGSLWATEPLLPARTHVAFGVMVAIGLSWAVYATWVLTTRRVLLGRHRLVAARMSVAFSSVFVLGCLLLAVATGHRAGYVAGGSGVVLLAVAVAMLVRARREVTRLDARRRTIERTLGEIAGRRP